jgi:hypothetical protein
MSRNYIPQSDAEFSFWSDNMLRKLGEYLATFNIPDPEHADLKIRRDAFENAVKDVDAAKTTLQSAVQAKNALRNQLESSLRQLVGLIKTHKLYTETIGEDIGVVLPAAPDKGDPLAKPFFTATVMGSEVRLDWTKGAYSGVIIQGKRNNETAFALLGMDTRSPFTDTRVNADITNSEARTYRMRYLWGDEEVGVWSDEVRVFCLIDATH